MMRRAECLALLVAGLFGVRDAHAIEHFGVDDSDRFLICARSLFGKPVFRERGGFRLNREIKIPCGVSREEFLSELKGTGTTMEPAEIKVIETPDLVLVYPSYLFYSRDAWIRWKSLSARITTRNFNAIPGSRPLDEGEALQIRNAILAEARTTPVVLPSLPGEDGETATLKITLWLDAHRLIAEGSESIIAILCEEGGAGRLIYGTLRDGKYEPSWDSPLFHALSLELGYRDMDGDGRDEILVGTQVEGRPSMSSLTVWNIQGRELTRQPNCLVDGNYAITEANGACPIVAESIEMDPRADGKRDILTYGYSPGRPSADESRPRLFRLVAGRYIAEATPPPRRSLPRKP